MDCTVQQSGVYCLRELIRKMHLTPDWDGVVTEDMLALYERDSVEALLKIGEAMDIIEGRQDQIVVELIISPVIIPFIRITLFIPL